MVEKVVRANFLPKQPPRLPNNQVQILSYLRNHGVCGKCWSGRIRPVFPTFPQFPSNNNPVEILICMEIMETAEKWPGQLLVPPFSGIGGKGWPSQISKSTSMNFENDLGVSIWLSERRRFLKKSMREKVGS